MHTTLTTLLDRLDSSAIAETNVIRWGCPVPSFGDLTRSTVATLGLNPSNREFVDESGNELDGSSRRFPTLTSLGLASWSDVDATHLESIIDSCRGYFLGNSYDRWFRRLDAVLTGTSASYYNVSRSACHLDLIPYATAEKWTDLSSRQKSRLLNVAGDSLGLLLSNSPVRLLILNGRSVIEQFQEVAGVSLNCAEMPPWSLRRKSVSDVKGLAYSGIVRTIGGIPLAHSLQILGFNHNLQSSFGVTTEAINAIRDWIAIASREALFN